jgi:hypothetical protein
MAFNGYYGRVQTFGGKWTTLPPWARAIVGIAAIPGLVLLALSIVAALVSILALLLLTVPVYGLLSAVMSGPAVSPETSAANESFVSSAPSSGRRHVDVKVIEPQSLEP